MNLQMYIKFNDQLFSRNSQDGLLVLSANEKNIFILQNVAEFICKKANGKERIADIIQAISEEFEVTHNKAEKDTIAFLNDATKHKANLFVLSHKSFK